VLEEEELVTDQDEIAPHDATNGRRNQHKCTTPL
jgi:hypothetical protein